MEFVAYLETQNDYDPAEVIAVFHLLIEYGHKALIDKCTDSVRTITEDLINSGISIERD